MNTNKNLIQAYLNNLIDYTTDLLEHDYPKPDILKYVLRLLCNIKENKKLSSEEFIELESNYLQKIIAIS
jgi:hypothetical protein